jgi:hypothetical protein
MPARPRTRGEIAELADRLRGVIDMENKLSITTATTSRI